MAFVLVFILGCFIGACAMLAAAMFLATAPDRERPDWSDGLPRPTLPDPGKYS